MKMLRSVFTWGLQSSSSVLAVVDGAGRKNRVREWQGSDIKDAKIQKLHHAAKTLTGEEGQNKVLVALRGYPVDVGSLVGLHVKLHPRVWSHWGQTPAEPLENDELHVGDFVLWASAVGDVGKFLQLWRVDLLNLGGDEETGNAWNDENLWDFAGYTIQGPLWQEMLKILSKAITVKFRLKLENFSSEFITIF